MSSFQVGNKSMEVVLQDQKMDADAKVEVVVRAKNKAELNFKEIANTLHIANAKFLEAGRQAVAAEEKFIQLEKITHYASVV